MDTDNNLVILRQMAWETEQLKMCASQVHDVGMSEIREILDNLVKKIRWATETLEAVRGHG